MHAYNEERKGDENVGTKRAKTVAVNDARETEPAA